MLQNKLAPEANIKHKYLLFKLLPANIVYTCIMLSIGGCFTVPVLCFHTVLLCNRQEFVYKDKKLIPLNDCKGRWCTDGVIRLTVIV